jgi:hypothetical protein
MAKDTTAADVAKACINIIEGVEFYLTREQVQSLRDTYKQEFNTIDKAWISGKECNTTTTRKRR